MAYQVECWHVSQPERILDVLKHVANFGCAIAWIRTRPFTGTLRQWQGKEIVDIGLVMPYCMKDHEYQHTHRTFNKMLFSISDVHNDRGIKVYETPISPYAPGVAGNIELEDCLYVPPYFSSIDMR
jgi:hypothetical protein